MSRTRPVTLRHICPLIAFAPPRRPFIAAASPDSVQPITLPLTTHSSLPHPPRSRAFFPSHECQRKPVQRLWREQRKYRVLLLHHRRLTRGALIMGSTLKSRSSSPNLRSSTCSLSPRRAHGKPRRGLLKVSLGPLSSLSQPTCIW